MIQKNILENLRCLKAQHNEEKIKFLCFDKDCNDSRLACIDCVQDHSHHASSLKTYSKIIAEIPQYLSTESQHAKGTLENFKLLQKKIISSLAKIEEELKRVCQLNIPNESAQELFDFLQKVEFNREELNEKIINYIKTTTDEQLQIQNAQRNLSTDQLSKFSQQISNYLTKLNEWLARMPKLNFKPSYQKALYKYAKDLEIIYQNKISPEKFLVQQISSKNPVRLNQIKHGMIEGHSQSEVYFNFYMGAELEKPFYKYSIKINQMINQGDNQLITKLHPPIYLYPKLKYCVSINSQDKLKILEFQQKLLEKPDQNFLFHPLDQIKGNFLKKYFIKEFIYDLIEIQ